MKLLIIVVLSTFITQFSVAGDKPTPANEYVKFELSLDQKKLKPGTNGQLLISLMPKKGIHINLQPPLDLMLEKNPAITLAGKPELARVRVDTSDYLDASKPIKQSFTLAKSAKKGSVTLKGTLTYFYCSDSEGWCSRFKQPINLTLTVTP